MIDYNRSLDYHYLMLILHLLIGRGTNVYTQSSLLIEKMTVGKKVASDSRPVGCFPWVPMRFVLLQIY